MDEFLSAYPTFSYALQIVLAECLFIAFVMPKRRLWPLTLLILGVAAVTGCMFLPDLILFKFIYVPMFVILLPLFVIAVAASDARMNAIVFCVVASALMQHMTECATMVVRFLLYDSLAWMWNYFSFITYPVLYAACILLFRRFVRKIETKPWGVVVFAACMYFGVFSLRNIAVSIVEEFSVSYGLIYNLYGVVCCFVCILFMCLQNSNQRLEAEHERMEELLSLEQEHYAQLVKSQDAVSRRCHDLKHQLKALRGDVAPEERAAFLDRLEKDVMIYESVAKTGSVALDRTLSEKCLFCGQNGVKFTYIVDAQAIADMEAIDIYTLFGNAIDNAVECVMKCPDEEKRIISMRVANQAGVLRIHIENYCEERVDIKDNTVATTKSDRISHGFGLRSIRYIAEKYGGILTLSQEERIFSLDIMVPLPLCTS